MVDRLAWSPRVSETSRFAHAGWIAVAAGLLLIVGRAPLGLALLLPAWLFLAVTNQRLFVLSAVIAVPLTTFGWDLPLWEIAGRTLDLRLAVTFAVAATSVLALTLSRPIQNPSRLELLFLGLVGWTIVSGILAADSYLTWGPPVARLLAYGALFALARRHLVLSTDLRLSAALVAIAFALPTFAGLIQYFIGDAAFINEAARATTPGGRGPIALAFAGQIALALGFALSGLPVSSRWAKWWIAAATIGGAGVLASATRLVTVTSWLVVAVFAALHRRWRTVAIVTVIFAAAFVIRPDLLGRFIGTVQQQQPTPSGQVGDPEDPAEPEIEVDASVRFRFFVWSTILEAWTEHPLTGIGPGMTAHVVAEESPAERTAPHNDYIGIFAELSAPGLALYLALQAAVLLALWRRWRSAPESEDDLVLMVGLLFVSLNVLGVLNNPIYFFDVQVALWALVGAALSQRESVQAAPTPSALAS